MGLLTKINRLMDGLRKFKKDRRGVSAIEFAFVFPIMITIYLGAVEITQLFSVDRKVTKVAGTLADLVAQAETLNTAQINDIFTASSAIMEPFDAKTLKVTVTSIKLDKDNKTIVAWSDSFGGAATRVPGQSITIPTGLTEPGTSIILTEVAYTYQSIVGEFATGPISITETFYTRPRYVAQIARN